MGRRLTVGVALASVLSGLVLTAVPAPASVSGRRTTAVVLTAAAAYQLLHGKTTDGLILGAGAAYAWKRTNDAKQARSREEERRRLAAQRRYYSSRYPSDRRHSHRYSSNRRDSDHSRWVQVQGYRSYSRTSTHDRGKHKGHLKHRD